MSDENPLERQLGRPLSRPALPPGEPELDDEPLTRPAHSVTHTPEHWPNEEAEVPSGDFTVTEGELIKTIEWYFPVIWLVCLITVSYIGIYHAVSQITTNNPLPPAWF